jgi:hypothetical protein
MWAENLLQSEPLAAPYLHRNLTAHDAWYVSLAETLGARLATLDARLRRASGPRCTFVAPARGVSGRSTQADAVWWAGQWPIRTLPLPTASRSSQRPWIDLAPACLDPKVPTTRL